MKNLSPGQLRTLKAWVTKRRGSVFSSSLRKEYTRVLIEINRALHMQLRQDDQHAVVVACSTRAIIDDNGGFDLITLVLRSGLRPI